MDALEYFQVESPEPAGAEYYRKIVGTVLQDLDLLKIISKLHVFIDPRIPIFVAVGVIRKLPSLIRVRDTGSVKIEDRKATISISDETYLASLVSVLTSRFGKDRVDQPDRFTVIITSDEPIGSDLEEVPIADPREGIYRDLVYALQYMAPEGFKVRRQDVRSDRFYYVASEDTLDDMMVRTLVRQKFSLMGVSYDL
ncbi:MAG: methanogenesis marker 17 protein [Methanomicrobiales archaeon]|nr:methanogenesis marker 17 protein [Methanomicrobiales archaeon]